MHSSAFKFILALAVLVLNTLTLVEAGLWVVNPMSGSVHHGGTEMTVDFIEDGQRPLLNAAGLCTVGLYTGKLQLVQSIPPVDVSKVHSLVFTPNPQAGPDSGTYFIAFTSTQAKTVNGSSFVWYSPFFALDQMSGSFDTPFPPATSTIPLPSTSSSNATTLPLSTVSVNSSATSSTPALSSSILSSSLSGVKSVTTTSSSASKPSSTPSSTTSSRFSTRLASSTPLSTSSSSTLASTSTSPPPQQTNSASPRLISSMLTHMLAILAFALLLS